MSFSYFLIMTLMTSLRVMCVKSLIHDTCLCDSTWLGKKEVTRTSWRVWYTRNNLLLKKEIEVSYESSSEGMPRNFFEISDDDDHSLGYVTERLHLFRKVWYFLLSLRSETASPLSSFVCSWRTDLKYSSHEEMVEKYPTSRRWGLLFCKPFPSFFTSHHDYPCRTKP